jgi:hypothetical protein
MQNHIRPDTLADFSPSGQKARDAALLRATTELFVQELTHDRDEIRRYEELATHFLPRVSNADRAFVAERLATRADAPQSVVRVLAKEHVDIACHVLRHSPVLGSLDLLTVIAATGPEHHRLIAERPELAPEVKRALTLASDLQTLETLHAPNIGTRPKSGTKPPILAHSAAHKSEREASQSDHLDIWRFLRLDRGARLRVMADLATWPPERRNSSSGRVKGADRAFRTILSAAQIVGYARSGKRQELVEAIAEGLDLDKAIATASFDDATGEAAAVLLKALGLDNVQAQQVLLLSTTTVALDANAFFRLTDVFAGMEIWVAETLVDAWRGQQPRSTPRHEPHLSENSVQRRPAAESGKKPKRLPPPAERASGA